MSEGGMAEAARAYDDPVGVALAAETALTKQLRKTIAGEAVFTGGSPL